MSLDGLPPKLTNQEFNTLFVATSNISLALELAAPVSEELNKLSLSGTKKSYPEEFYRNMGKRYIEPDNYETYTRRSRYKTYV
ncbi:hypothetical protein BY996DRAFT_6609895 [Phakopsora pachyrhizi]|nr:hypothetical protein BY996DRAFT_6609895 [Phakopsora pachyrhizi]